VGLPARQRRVLEGIDSELRGSDPRLAAMFVIFGRLTCDEEMPRIEELRDRAAILLLRVRLVLSAAGLRLRGRRRDSYVRQAGVRQAGAQRTGTRRLRGRIRMAVFFPIALMLMTLTVVLVARFGSPARCAAVSSVATAKPHPRGKLVSKGVRLCRPPTMNPLPMGR
jgi:hypothetical protein